jgi:hypothetical protein
VEAETEQYSYYPTSSSRIQVVESRPSLSREASYSSKPFKVKYSKNYGEEDVQHSSYYPAPAYREEYQSAYA